MWFDYSCCDFCPYGCSDELLDCCKECEARAAERQFNRMMAGLEPEDYDPWEDDYAE